MKGIGALLASCLLIAAPQAGQGVPLGYWANPSGSVIVEISECGQDILCGRVSWASDKAAADARAGGTDPLIGTELLHRFAPAGPARWRGKLFVPDLKKTSRADLQVIDDMQLKITGCAVGRLLCRSQIWRRTDSATPPAAN